VRRGQHAADDGSFSRSAAVNAGRGALLILVALIVGFVLLKDFDDASGGGATNVSATPETTAEPPTTEPLSTLPTTTTLPVRAPKDVKVLAINATTVDGAARRVSDVLRRGGYNVLAPVSASPSVKSATRASAVYYASKEFEREAKRLQSDLGLPPTPVTIVPTPPPTADLRGANVIIVVGPDLAQTRPGTSTTTARSGATTTTTD
jgi:hypothetical protein